MHTRPAHCPETRRLARFADAECGSRHHNGKAACAAIETDAYRAMPGCINACCGAVKPTPATTGITPRQYRKLIA